MSAKCQKRTSRPLFDPFVGAGEQLRGHCQTKPLGCLETNYQLEFGGLLDGEVSWFRAMENPVNIVGRTPVLIGDVGSIGHQTARLDVLTKAVHRRQLST